MDKEKRLEELAGGKWYSFPDGSGILVTPDVDACFLGRERKPDMWWEDGEAKYKKTEMENPAIWYHRSVLGGSKDQHHREVARLFEDFCREYRELLESD